MFVLRPKTFVLLSKMALSVSKLILLYFCKNFASNFDAIYSVYTENTEYSAFRISQKYKSRKIPPFTGPYFETLKRLKIPGLEST